MLCCAPQVPAPSTTAAEDGDACDVPDDGDDAEWEDPELADPAFDAGVDDALDDDYGPDAPDEEEAHIPKV